MPRKEMEALHKNDLNALLESLGMLEEFAGGHVQCKFCQAPLNGSNAGAILTISGHLSFVCNETNCLLKLRERV